MVLGIVSVVFCCFWYISIVTSVIGLILGIISLKKEDAGKGMAITGVILSGIGVVIAIFMIVCLVTPIGSVDYYADFYSDFY